MSRLRAPLGLIAAAAMLGSHWAAYLLSAPDPHDRAHLLQTTGHGYWPLASSIAVAALVLGLGTFIGRSFTPTIRSSRARILGHALPRLLYLQIGGFVTLEVLERFASGHGIGASILVQKTMLVGVALQVVVAVLASVALAFIALVVDRLVRRPAPATHGASTLTDLVSYLSTPRLVPATGAHTLRGPPVRP